MFLVYYKCLSSWQIGRCVPVAIIFQLLVETFSTLGPLWLPGLCEGADRQGASRASFKGPALEGVVLHCGLEILSNFWINVLHFYFVLCSANHMAYSSSWVPLLTCIFTESVKPLAGPGVRSPLSFLLFLKPLWHMRACLLKAGFLLCNITCVRVCMLKAVTWRLRNSQKVN